MTLNWSSRSVRLAVAVGIGGGESVQPPQRLSEVAVGFGESVGGGHLAIGESEIFDGLLDVGAASVVVGD